MALIKVLSELMEKEIVDKKQIRDIEKYASEMYGKKQLDLANGLCLEIFLKNYKPKTRGAVISCVKKIESTTLSLPPCSCVIKEKIRRTKCNCGIWNNATEQNNPQNFQPTNCGWFLKNSKFKITWFDWEISPSTVKIICSENGYHVSSVITVII